MVAGGQKVANVATFGMVGGQNKKNDGGKQSMKAPKVLVQMLLLGRYQLFKSHDQKSKHVPTWLHTKSHLGTASTDLRELALLSSLTLVDACCWYIAAAQRSSN